MKAALLAMLSGLALAGCGSSTGSLTAGEACHASSECGPDLLCDFSQQPPVCAGQGPPPADAAVIDGRPIPTPDAKPGTPDARPPDATVDAMPDA